MRTAEPMAAEAPAPPAPTTTARERWTIYLMLSGQIMNNLAIRFGLPALLLFMRQEFGWNDLQFARITGSFFPGYMLTQVPAGWIAQHFGGKDILTLNMAGNAVLLCLLPAAARAGENLLYVTLSIMGAFQGPLIPCQGAIKAEWLKGLGPERPFVLRVMGLGSKIAATLTGWAVPALSSRWGWRSVPYVYGVATAVFAALWHFLASNAPPSAEPASGAAAQKPKKKAEWGIMKVRAVQSTVWAHIVDNHMTYTMNQMGPIIYTSVCGVPAESMGIFLAIPPTLNVCGSFIVGRIEKQLLLRGLSSLRIQKVMSWAGGVVEAVFFVWFGRCRTSFSATVAWCGVVIGHLLHGSGFYTNYEDIGGPDAAILWACDNTLASLPGFVSPMIAAAIFRRTGSYTGLFDLSAAMQISLALFFGACASTTPARELLAAQRAQ